MYNASSPRSLHQRLISSVSACGGCARDRADNRIGSSSHAGPGYRAPAAIRRAHQDQDHASPLRIIEAVVARNRCASARGTKSIGCAWRRAREKLSRSRFHVCRIPTICAGRRRSRLITALQDMGEGCVYDPVAWSRPRALSATSPLQRLLFWCGGCSALAIVTNGSIVF